MIDIVWSVEARKDLERLRAFIAERDPDAAGRAAATIARAATGLARHPEAGRSIEDTPLRAFVVPFGRSAYVVHYRLDPARVVIARVWHSREARR